MRKVNIILTIAFAAFLYACGAGKGTENAESADSTKAVETADNQATTEVVEAKEPVDLYKYFTKEEIEQKMANALEIFKDSIQDNESGLASRFGRLLEEEGFGVSPEQIVKKWGKPDKKTLSEHENPVEEGSTVKDVSFTYPIFGLDLESFDEPIWLVSTIHTDTPGFGFAGIYVGIKECNKEYVKKLLQHVNIDEGTNEDGFEQISSSLNSEIYTTFNVVFDKNGIVKSVNYFCANYID